MIRMTRRRRSKETAKNSYNLTKTMRGARSDESTMRSGTWSAAVKKQRRRRPRVEPLLLEETTQRQPSMLGEDARVLRTPVPDPCVYADRLIRPRVHTRDDGRRCRADQKHGGEVGDDRLGDRVAEGLAALRVVHRRAPHASPGDTGVEEERPVTMSKKRHAVDGRWATQSRSMIE